jgi:translation initiation factor IF-3
LLLREIDQSTQFIELVSEKPNPIVRIRDKKEARDQEKQLKERRASSRTVLKEIKVSWVISSGDLDHKVTQMRQNLSKGYKVSVVFAAKPGQLPPPVTESEKVLDRVVDSLKDVATLQRLVQEGKGITSHTTAYFTGRDRGAQANHNKMASDSRVQGG